MDVSDLTVCDGFKTERREEEGEGEEEEEEEKSGARRHLGKGEWSMCN